MVKNGMEKIINIILDGKLSSIDEYLYGKIK